MLTALFVTALALVAVVLCRSPRPVSHRRRLFAEARPVSEARAYYYGAR